jgi:hypothetical protein
MTRSANIDNSVDTCKCVGCNRLLSREGYCRPHFISEVLGWNFRGDHLRLIPLGLLNEEQHRELVSSTRHADSVFPILELIRLMDIKLPKASKAALDKHRETSPDAGQRDWALRRFDGDRSIRGLSRESGPADPEDYIYDLP